MDITTIKIKDNYLKLIKEDGEATCAVSTSAPEGAMSAGPLQAEFFTNPKLSIYYPATGKRKYFKRQLQAEEYLKKNPDWKPLTECDDTTEIKEIIEKLNKKKKHIWSTILGYNDQDYSDDYSKYDAEDSETESQNSDSSDTE